jgi:hypothetical protein
MILLSKITLKFVKYHLYNDGGRGGPGWAMVPPPNKGKKIEVKNNKKKCKIWL